LIATIAAREIATLCRVPARKAKHTKITREEILKSIGWEPLDFPPDVPADVVEAENRRMQDEIVGWVQGLAAHIDKYDQAQKLPAARSRVHRTGHGADRWPRGRGRLSRLARQRDHDLTRAPCRAFWRRLSVG